MRPGCKDFMLLLLKHDRIKFGLYSSIMRKNVEPIYDELFDESHPELHSIAKEKGLLIFD